MTSRHSTGRDAPAGSAALPRTPPVVSTDELIARWSDVTGTDAFKVSVVVADALARQWNRAHPWRRRRSPLLFWDDAVIVTAALDHAGHVIGVDR